MRAEPVLAEPEPRSPGSNAVTPAPSDSTMTPANSQPRTVTFDFDRPAKNRTIHGWAARKPQSVRFTVVAWTDERLAVAEDR